MKKVIIVGAGPGGLTAGMLLSHKGFEVEIYEKESSPGGRNASINQDGFTFDIGPTFLMMKFILDEVFKETKRESSDYLQFTRLDPMYRLYFADKSIDISDNNEKMRSVIAEHFPGNEDGYNKLLKTESLRFKKMYPCLQKPYLKLSSLWNRDLLKAYPYLSLSKSMHDVLSGYFKNDELRLSFTFQSKYLGMSPWSCPAAFMIIPYIEHAYGVYHVTGGLSKISETMAEIIKQENGKIYYDTPVKSLIIENRKTKGVKLVNGEDQFADEIIINSDFAYSMTNLVDGKTIKKWNYANLMKKDFSCSTFMIYLGLDKEYDIPHHSIVFSRDYKKYINDIMSSKHPSSDLSFYIRNASVTDKSLAPKGNSNIYVLVPVSNKKSGFVWKDNKESFRDMVIRQIMERTELKDISKHIVTEKIITPDDWENNYNVFLGATFNLAHSIFQMLYFRPRNKFEEFKNCWLVGGGTHPGSGLPTIYESGKITANLISKKYNPS